ncbi:MAG: bifunctional methylenetetrahydrofolate dehydrogenase/methenyltetrahydrofolate cyclohydrolase FolD [Ruminococcaceae bacterium]|nr:bifunctional methylenetetrahydrofolate dehydrogenase/methenyltetrahydrofolate cyclohydrolase FolD [Oscillospiraceae bacterium]
MTNIIDGKAVSKAIRDKVSISAEKLPRKPGLAVILVGEDPASQVYVKNKEKACLEVGFYSEMYRLPESCTEEELLSLVKKLNADEKIDGILVQLPLPKHLNADTVINNIDPRKDVDAFHPINVGKIMIGKYDFLPCTPAGVMEMLSYYEIDPKGKNCVVIGRSNIVGKPMAMLLLHKDATVTVCHSKTRDLKKICKEADILVAAVGKAEFVTEDMVKEGAVVIDVGMNRNSEGKLVGDVDYKNVFEKCSYISPVPGGVGPMTISMLMKNTLKASALWQNCDISK